MLHKQRRIQARTTSLTFRLRNLSLQVDVELTGEQEMIVYMLEEKEGGWLKAWWEDDRNDFLFRAAWRKSVVDSEGEAQSRAVRHRLIGRACLLAVRPTCDEMKNKAEHSELQQCAQLAVPPRAGWIWRSVWRAGNASHIYVGQSGFTPCWLKASFLA